jgi:hypothetical protein
VRLSPGVIHDDTAVSYLKFAVGVSAVSITGAYLEVCTSLYRCLSLRANTHADVSVDAVLSRADVTSTFYESTGSL